MTPIKARQQTDNECPPGIREDIDVTFFIPCLNEELRVTQTLDTLTEAMRGFELTYEAIVIDDGSTDNTSKVVEAYKVAHPDVPLRLHRNEANLGLARCFVDTSFVGRGIYYRLICGDNIEPKESMAAVILQLGKADIIIPYYPQVPGKGPVRLAISNGFTWLVNLVSGHKLRYYNGNPLYRRYDVMRWAPHNFGFGYQADLLTQLLDLNATFIEIPINGIHRAKDRASTLKVRNLLSVAHSLLEIVIRRMRRIVFQR